MQRFLVLLVSFLQKYKLYLLLKHKNTVHSSLNIWILWYRATTTCFLTKGARREQSHVSSWQRATTFFDNGILTIVGYVPPSPFCWNGGPCFSFLVLHVFPIKNCDQYDCSFFGSFHMYDVKFACRRVCLWFDELGPTTTSSEVVTFPLPCNYHGISGSSLLSPMSSSLDSNSGSLGHSTISATACSPLYFP